jgi:hypothetical protein
LALGHWQEKTSVDDTIAQIRRFVRASMETVTAPDWRIAHDFKHVDGVRRWALHIASA